MITLSTLERTNQFKKQRIGRGNGSHRGKNSGAGHKGQVKRGKVRIGFEGGQKALTRRLPKLRGFNQPANLSKAVLTLSALDRVSQDGDVVTLNYLLEKKLISDKVRTVRFINTGTLGKKLTFSDEANIYLTKGAKSSI